MENQFEHFSHDHPLTTLFADFKEVDDKGKDPEPYLCSICGLPILSSPSYTCSISGCSYFLHKPCAQLPKSLQHPRYHPFTLLLKPHTLELIQMPESSPRIFTYHCNECEINFHPLVTGAVELKIQHKSHQAHFLVANCRETLSVCDACGEEQRGFFFTCHECNFWIHHFKSGMYCKSSTFVHDVCVILLSRIDFSKEEEPNIFPYGGIPCPDPRKYVFDSIFPCWFCHRPCNGLCCLTLKIPFMACLECVVMPVTITHASHRQHVLVRTSGDGENTMTLSCCSTKSHYQDIFRCVHCSDFYILVGCALLPKRTRHKFDEHPLKLITQRHDCSSEPCFCEFCEEVIDRQYWCYSCGKCGNYFHINCIPSVGYLSRFKLGKTHVDHKIHGHPLALTRMLTVGRHEKCGYCKEIIPGFVDKMAFQCFQCDFWIHFDCARDSSCQPDLPVYSQVEEKVKLELLT